MEGREDEIGLAKASPFSFLPEASLLASPSLSKEGLGRIVGVLSANGLLKRTHQTRLAAAQASLLRDAFLCAPAGSAST